MPFLWGAIDPLTLPFSRWGDGVREIFISNSSFCPGRQEPMFQIDLLTYFSGDRENLRSEIDFCLANR